jgi:hypothetical protein
VTVSLTATTPVPTTGYVASADIAATPTNFYVTGVADTVTSYIAVKLNGPNYLKCLRGTNYGTAALTGFGHMKSASIIARFNTRGTYTFTANYLGDAANAPGKSTALTVNVL